MIFKKIIKISAFTNIFEWYDFTVYSFLAVPIGVNFFNPHMSHRVILLNSLLIFAIGYLIRPLGSIFFGYIGDKYSVNIALKYSILIMSLPTIFIGILPNYKTLGFYSTILLLVMRLVQGFGAGGEMPTCATFVYKYNLHKKYNKVFFCSLINIGGMCGVLGASFIVLLIYHFFSLSQINDFAWRIPFMIGIPITYALFKFRSLLENQKENLTPYNEVKPIKNSIIKSLAMMSYIQVSFYINFVWIPIYLENYLHISHQVAKSSNVIALLSLVIFTLISSYISKFFSYNYVIKVGAYLVLLLSYPLLLLLNSHIITLIYLAQVFLALINAPIQGTYIYKICNILDSKNINKKFAISYTIPSAIFGGTSVYICSLFHEKFFITNFPGLYITFFAFVFLITLIRS
jgi:MFS transporter, MHS family, proline/betaine transporter